MREFTTWLLTIDSPDEDVRRRGRNIVLMALGLITLCVLFTLLLLFSATPAQTYVTIVIGAAIYIGVLIVARRGWVTLSAIVFILALMSILFISIWITQSVLTAPFFLVLPLLIAGLSLRPWQIWVVLACVVIGLFATLMTLPNRPLMELEAATTVYGSVLLFGLVALMSFLGAKSTKTALQYAHNARQQAETLAHALSGVNTNLEATVAERTAALQSALRDVQTRSDEQARLLGEIQQQRITLRELSVPVIPISASTLIMPLVGALDSLRLQHIQEQALRALEHKSARYLVLDITGVPIVDSQVAQGLISVVQAARLLGAQVLLVGIRPEVAQAIVGLGLDLREIYTTSDLQSALSHIALN
jgi:rsbT co-antagonist protein RsbR